MSSDISIITESICVTAKFLNCIVTSSWLLCCKMLDNNCGQIPSVFQRMVPFKRLHSPYHVSKWQLFSCSKTTATPSLLLSLWQAWSQGTRKLGGVSKLTNNRSSQQILIPVTCSFSHTILCTLMTLWLKSQPSMPCLLMLMTWP